jgi:predicted peptidase
MIACLCAISLLLAARDRKNQEMPVDRPRLSPNVALRDVTFHSAALNRDMQYRVVLPTSIAADAKLPAIYFRHGGDGSFRDWSNYSGSGRPRMESMGRAVVFKSLFDHMGSNRRPEARFRKQEES